MNDAGDIKPEDRRKYGLALLRSPFPEHQIGKLPKPTKQQTDEVKTDYKKGTRCNICGGWHHPKVVHLDYIGHAALTDRLLDADPEWKWEPLAYKDGLPAFDSQGGLWIKLTVHDVTRLGYGNAEISEHKDVGNREKEVIGDALRNAAMRFGAALELWHKGDLRLEEDKKDLAKEDVKEENKKASQSKKITIKTSDSAPTPKNETPIEREQLNALLTRLKAIGKDGQKFYDYLEKKYQVKGPFQLRRWQYEEVMELLEEK